MHGREKKKNFKYSTRIWPLVEMTVMIINVLLFKDREEGHQEYKGQETLKYICCMSNVLISFVFQLFILPVN